MKKTILSALAIAAVAFTLTSCGPSKSFTATKAATETAITQIKAATTPEELTSAGMALQASCDSIVKAYGEEMAEDETKQMEDLKTTLGQAIQEKATELAALAAKAEQEAADLKAQEEEEEEEAAKSKK